MSLNKKSIKQAIDSFNEKKTDGVPPLSFEEVKDHATNLRIINTDSAAYSFKRVNRASMELTAAGCKVQTLVFDNGALSFLVRSPEGVMQPGNVERNRLLYDLAQSYNELRLGKELKEAQAEQPKKKKAA